MIKNNLKLLIKELIGKTIKISNLTKSVSKDKFYIFCYHEVTDYPSVFQKKNKLYVTKKVFIKQIKFIKRLFRIASPNELINGKNCKNSALITFDDGYANSFRYALPHLNKNKIVPIFFLNMSAIKNKLPLLPASIEYLEKNLNKFNVFIDNQKISKPTSLFIKPSQFKKFNDDINLRKKKINTYQGKMIDFNFLTKNQKNSSFFIANHLYEHYNCKALNNYELIHLIMLNVKILKKFRNNINFFSFPNGVPNLCFEKINVNLIKSLKFKKAFSSGNKVNFNSNRFLLDRINLNNDDNTFNKFLFKIFQSTKRT